MPGFSNVPSRCLFPQPAPIALKQSDHPVDRVLMGSVRRWVLRTLSAKQLVMLLAMTMFASQCLRSSTLWGQQIPRPHHAAAPAITGTDGSQTGTAGFQGNFTTIQTPTGALALGRQPDCSFGLASGTYTISASGVTYTETGITPHYEQVLHKEAELTTTSNVFAKGCAMQPPAGFGSEPGVFVGTTKTGVQVFAGLGLTYPNYVNGIYLLTGKTTFSLTSFQDSSAGNLTAGDLNKDGNGDLIISNSSLATSGFVTVMLGNADGSFQNGVAYPIAGNYSVAATVDDVNGDGIPDIIAVSGDQQISVLPGKGDGSFGTAMSFTAPLLPGYTSASQAPIMNLITADLRGIGKRDLIASNGLVFLGKGDGTFTAVSSPAFPYVADNLTSYGPFIAAGDLNNDGKVDLAVSVNGTVTIWLGKGTGSFARGPSYDAINSDGYISITDIDGDGNSDIYVGLGDGAFYGGDEGSPNLAYALMGNGDGTFRGAPAIPARAYSGNNLMDVNGDGVPDMITNATASSNAAATFTVWLGDGKGGFSQGATITAPDTFTINGYQFTGVAKASATSYAVGDVNGDGKADLVFVDNYLTAINPGSGFPITYPYPVYFVALGNGDGTFKQSTPYAFPQIAPSADFDNTSVVSNLEIADFNHDSHADLIFVYDETAGGSGVNPYNRGFAVLPGKGDGTFKAPVLTSTYSGTTAPTTAAVPQIDNVEDLNGDGNPDLIVNAPGTTVINFQLQTQLQVFLSNGDGTFKSPVNVAVGANSYATVVADLNKDGKPDLAVLAETSSAQAELGILRGNGDGTFGTAAISNLGGGDAIRSSGLAAADFDGDGSVDLALIESNDFSGVFYGKGDGTFISVPLNGNIIPKDLISISAEAPAVAVDMNKDGKPDILAGGVSLISQAVPTLTGSKASTTTLSASSKAITVGSSVKFTATVAPSSGTGSPTGSVTFMDGSTTLSTGALASGVATYSTSSLPVGSQSVTAVYSGDTTFNASTSAAVTVVVSAATPLAATSTTLTASATSAATGAALTFTAKVAETSGSGIPAGTVTFFDGTTALGSGTLASGTASYSNSTLSVGTHSITASYGGDSSNAVSTSSALSVVISASAGDFAMAMSPASGTAKQGGTVTSTVTITPTGGFNKQISFSCSELPKDASCSFSPASVTPEGSSPATSTLSIKTNVASSAVRAPAQGGSGLGSSGTTALAFLGAGGVFGIALMRRRINKALGYVYLGLALVALAVSAAVGCGSSSGSKTSAGTYQVTITSTSGATTHSATYTLTVQ